VMKLKIVDPPEPHKMTMLRPPPDCCQLCAVKHGPAEPHNADSLYYQMKFHELHDRWPTWEDAIAHCSRSIKRAARKILRKHLQPTTKPHQKEA
jgi:hypothetical protein